jgi:hypothetical protein
MIASIGGNTWRNLAFSSFAESPLLLYMDVRLIGGWHGY